MLHLQFLLVWAQTLRERTKGDEGSPTLETVIIAAALAAVAIAAAALIVAKIMSHANAVQ
ncbi:MAG: hypothetical protein M3O32_01435 [Actinomycetota bacterium]|nr:hypothetical protein [Actinomycetota bacterium]